MPGCCDQTENCYCTTTREGSVIFVHYVSVCPMGHTKDKRLSWGGGDLPPEGWCPYCKKMYIQHSPIPQNIASLLPGKQLALCES